jgi:hypothetical protein
MDQSRQLNCLSLMKYQLASQEALLECHTKVKAMLEMILAKDLVDYPQAKLHDYLWAVSDLVGKARELNGELLVGMMPLLEESKCLLLRQN